MRTSFIPFLCSLMGACFWRAFVLFLAGGVVVTVASQSMSTPYPYDYHTTVTSHTVATVTPLSGPVAGGTVVTVLGTKFAGNATVTFVERDSAGSLTGLRSECVWRSLPGVGSSDAMVR